MVEFSQWSESLIFAAVFAVLIIVPCILVTLMGRKFIDKLGRFPTQTAFIQIGIFLRLLILEIVTFTCILGFYQFFTSNL